MQFSVVEHLPGLESAVSWFDKGRELTNVKPAEILSPPPLVLTIGLDSFAGLRSASSKRFAVRQIGTELLQINHRKHVCGFKLAA